MKASSKTILNQATERYPALRGCMSEIECAAEIIMAAYSRSGKLLVCGNGGSASDATHIVGELMKSFVLPRPVPAPVAAALHRENTAQEAEFLCTHLQGALSAISLTTESSLLSAYANDAVSDLVYAQQVLGYGRPGDVLLGITTSGNSKNVLEAARVARALDMRVVALTGQGGGKIRALADACVCVPASETYRVQEYHLPVYHALCLAIENEFFGDAE